MKGVLSIKIEKSLIQRIKEFCKDHGLKQGFFVEKALAYQLEKEELMEDIVELKPNFCGIGLNINALIRKRGFGVKIKNLLKAFIHRKSQPK